MHGRLHHVVLDCPDPRALARFYSELLNQPITYDSNEFTVVAADDTSSGLGFQRVADHRPPTWPEPGIGQQLHLDVMVDDVAASAAYVLSLGARSLDRGGPGEAGEPGESGGVVFADPAGHPFCLIPLPTWAEPIGN